MSSEQVIKWGGRLAILLIAIGVALAVFWYDPEAIRWGQGAKPAASEGDAKPLEKTAGAGSEVLAFKPLDRTAGGLARAIADILAEAARKRGGVVVGILHCHVPGNVESEDIADSLNVLSQRYGNQVQVIRADIVAYPEVAQAEGVTNPPKVVMLVGSERVFSFQGLWPYLKIQRKLDEILHGLKRMGRNWRPDVKGMQKGGTPPPTMPPSTGKQGSS